MSWRALHVSERACLSLKQGSVVLRRAEEEEYSFSLEDMGFLMLETTAATLSSALLNACVQKNCVLVCCDEAHMPSGVLLPFAPYHRQLETVKAQLSLSLPRQKRLWQQIIFCKIRNQAACLVNLGRNKEQIRKVAALEAKVQNNDANND